jgi:NAD(P)-dependent dehydrogenase (short-subunit alcohol dehydrogenase family)
MHGLTVVIGSRSLKAGQFAAKSVGADARRVQLDVADPASIAGAANWIRNELGRLDVLVNNAGSSRADVPGRSFDQATATDPLTVASLDEIRTVLEANVFGVIAVTQTMLPLLREAPAGRVVNIGSSAGSLTLNSDPAHPRPWMFGAYSASMAASRVITVALPPSSNRLASRSMPHVLALPPRISTTSAARAPSEKLPMSPCGSHC